MALNNDKIHIKNNKPKNNDGGHNAFGVDIDPKKDLVHNTHEDGSYTAYYKGSKMKFDDYVSELESRYDKNTKGKDFASRSIGLFGGFGKGKLKKNY
tara:strand:- start:199 stop:489 length:291 start_codon:yes stop_codon:yes gene_type:complete